VNKRKVNKKKGVSHFWKGLMDFKDHLLGRGHFEVHSGHQTSFWSDLWIGNEPLMKVYPSLYNLARNKKVMVAKVLSTSPLNISIRRALVGANQDKWMDWLGLYYMYS
jgi:hypothetical protein